MRGHTPAQPFFLPPPLCRGVAARRRDSDFERLALVNLSAAGQGSFLAGRFGLAPPPLSPAGLFGERFPTTV